MLERQSSKTAVQAAQPLYQELRFPASVILAVWQTGAAVCLFGPTRSTGPSLEGNTGLARGTCTRATNITLARWR